MRTDVERTDKLNSHKKTQEKVGRRFSVTMSTAGFFKRKVSDQTKKNYPYR
jgi:hypothetical protein